MEQKQDLCCVATAARLEDWVRRTGENERQHLLNENRIRIILLPLSQTTARLRLTQEPWSCIMKGPQNHHKPREEQQPSTH